MSQIETNGYPFASRFTGLSPEGWPQGDRDGNAEDLAVYYSEAFTTGVYKRNGTSLSVEKISDTMRVRLLAGSCLIRGHVRYVSAPTELTLTAPGSTARTDYIVMRLSTAENERRITPVAVSGSIPADTAEVAYTPLAKIDIPANATNLNSATLTDMREYVRATGDPAYYPPGSLPELLWTYAVFPETMTPAQIAQVEGNPSLMAMFNASRLSGGWMNPLIARVTVPSAEKDPAVIENIADRFAQIVLYSLGSYEKAFSAFGEDGVAIISGNYFFGSASYRSVTITQTHGAVAFNSGGGSQVFVTDKRVAKIMIASRTSGIQDETVIVQGVGRLGE